MSEKSIEAEYKKYKDDVPVTLERQNVGVSPCQKCPNEFGDKGECVEECLRLEEFQFNRPYEHIEFYCSQRHAESLKDAQMTSPLPEPPKTAKPRTQEVSRKRAMPIKQKKPIMVQKPKPTIPAPMTYEEKIKIIRETTSWKKVFPKKKKADKYEQLKKLISEGGQCLLCKNKSERMGLCMVCWQRWYHGRVKHPVIESYRTMTREEIILARHGNPAECLIEGCTRVGCKRGLCGKDYKKWRLGKILHPVWGVWIPKRKEANVEEKAEYKTSLKTEGQKETHSILIDFTSYPDLYRIIKEISKLQHLPANHVVLNQIATGIMYSEDKAAEEKVRGKLKDAIHK